MRLFEYFEICIWLKHENHVLAAHVVYKEIGEYRNDATRFLPHEKLSLILEHSRLASDHE